MDTSAPPCVLCDHAASMIDTDHGNRRYVACSNVLCGDYEISRRAAKELATQPHRKALLKDQVVLANAEGKVLTIVVGATGEIEVSASLRPE